MEKKTIGGFLAALRKANGMTQKDLAERLNVSDKTVSRWERDDGTPDLAVIPVIAEIFGVTCDELLRGERRPPLEREGMQEELTRKGEKQRKRLLTVSLSAYKTRTLISMGIAVTGLLVAMAVNFGFLREQLGFFAGAVFLLIGVVAQAVFVNGAFLSVSDDGLSAAEAGMYKKSVIRWAERSFGLAAVLLGFSLPLIIFMDDAYVGLNLYSWLFCGAISGLAALGLFCVVCFFLNAALLKRGVYTLDEKERSVYEHNHKLKGRCGAALAVLLLATCIMHVAVTELRGPYELMEGTTFRGFDSFAAFMQRYIPDPYGAWDDSGADGAEIYYDQRGNAVTMDDMDSSATYYDQNGNSFMLSFLLDDEGNVFEYIDRNDTVCGVSFDGYEEQTPIFTAYTHQELKEAQIKVTVRHALFVAAYALEAVAVLAVYFRKREK